MILDDVVAGKYWRGTAVPTASEQDAYLHTLQELESAIAMLPPGAEKWRRGFWVQKLRSLRTSSREMWLLSQLKGRAPEGNAAADRDRQGAENMLWLATERYPGRKIVVWAATSHLFRNKGLDPSQCVTPEDVVSCNYVPMGQYVWERLGRDAYVIGFTAYGGNKGFVVGGKPAVSWAGPLEQDQHPSIEMEELLNAAGFDYAFLDLHTSRKGGGWLKTPIRSRPLGNHAGLRNWTEALDAMFFIREQQFDTRKAQGAPVPGGGRRSTR
jgi:erythromycin esterase